MNPSPLGQLEAPPALEEPAVLHPLHGAAEVPQTAGTRDNFVFTPAHRNAGQPVRRLSSSQLFGDCREIEIEHGGSCYRLRQTALGKLIMTK